MTCLLQHTAEVEVIVGVAPFYGHLQPSLRPQVDLGTLLVEGPTRPAGTRCIRGWYSTAPLCCHRGRQSNDPLLNIHVIPDQIISCLFEFV